MWHEHTCPLSPPHNSTPTTISPPGYDYDAAYDDEYPPQQPYPHPGIRGLQVIAPQHQLMRYSLSRAVWRRRTAVRCWWFAQSSTVGIWGGGLWWGIWGGRGRWTGQQGWVSLSYFLCTDTTWNSSFKPLILTVLELQDFRAILTPRGLVCTPTVELGKLAHLWWAGTTLCGPQLHHRAALSL